MEDKPENGEMKTLVSALNSLVRRGFSEDFIINDEGLKSLKTEIVYQPDQVKVASFYRFEGISDPADESILYAIETQDGSKGTLVDAFGPHSDSRITSFMQKVQEIGKKLTT